MKIIQVPDFCTISDVCKNFGFTYYTVTYWLNHNLVKWIPAGTKKLVNMEDLNRFLNGMKDESEGGDINAQT